ncbi:MAG: hypothetical protein RL607_2438 [Bacteroidota bacterium]
MVELLTTELNGINDRIKEVSTALSSSTLTDTYLIRNYTELIEQLTKRKNELTQKINKLKKDPEETDLNESTFVNKIGAKEARYTFLNAVNFDFNDNKTNYVGHFNIYVPSIEKNRWGINVGILKVNYQTRDSIINYATQNVLQQPLDVPDADGETYLQMYNRSATTTQVTATSFYAQLLWKTSKVGKATIYLHAHAELLYTQYRVNTYLKTLQQDTITIGTQNPAPDPTSLVKRLDTTTSKTVHLASPHFGVGSTIDFNFKDDCTLFLQPTVGVALNYVNRFPAQDADGNYTLQTYSKAQGFFMVRTYFQYNTSSATQIILGTDIRGMLPDQQPYFAAYVGLNVGIDKLFK